MQFWNVSFVVLRVCSCYAICTIQYAINAMFKMQYVRYVSIQSAKCMCNILNICNICNMYTMCNRHRHAYGRCKMQEMHHVRCPLYETWLWLTYKRPDSYIRDMTHIKETWLWLIHKRPDSDSYIYRDMTVRSKMHDVRCPFSNVSFVVESVVCSWQKPQTKHSPERVMAAKYSQKRCAFVKSYPTFSEETEADFAEFSPGASANITIANSQKSAW